MSKTMEKNIEHPHVVDDRCSGKLFYKVLTSTLKPEEVASFLGRFDEGSRERLAHMYENCKNCGGREDNRIKDCSYYSPRIDEKHASGFNPLYNEEAHLHE